MKFVGKSQAVEFRNSDTCVAFEYQLNDPDINGAVIRLSGRYPGQGFAINEVSKELVYVTEGQGTLTVGEADYQLSKGDMALLMPGDKCH